MSLCVTELKNNMAVYLDNLEVKSPAVNKGRGGAGPDSLARGHAGPIAQAPATGTK